MTMHRDDAGSNGTTNEERRGATQRVRFEALVDVGEPKGNGFEAESIDVSPEGMRLRAAYLPKIGDKLLCRFDGSGSELVVEGEVIWRHDEARGGEFGLQFQALDEVAAAALRTLCAPTNDDANGSAGRRGALVRLHIDGLGAPMKARVREEGAGAIEVGSSLEFLKVGRILELEGTEAGDRRGAYVDRVGVDVDPATNVPQLVVALRFDAPSEASARPQKPVKSAKSEARTGSRGGESRNTEKASARDSRSAAAATRSLSGETEIQGNRGQSVIEDEAADDTAMPRKGAVEVGADLARRVGPAIAGLGTKGKDAVTAMVAKLREKRAEAKQAAAPRRTTAAAPGGALKSEGRRLVREEITTNELEIPTGASKKPWAVGVAAGLVLIAGVVVGTRVLHARSGEQPAEQTAAAEQTVAADPSATPLAALAAPAASAAPATPVGSGVLSANVPLFGATPLSTTEIVPTAAPLLAGSAAPVAALGAPMPTTPDPAVAAEGEGDDAAANDGAPAKKEWGPGGVNHPVVLKVKMDGAVDRVQGSAGNSGFTITVPGRRALSSSNDLVHKDKRLASVNVVNNAGGAEITVQFKGGVPSGYLAKANGDRLDISLGTDKGEKSEKHDKKKSDKKIASKSKKKGDDAKASRKRSKKKSHK